MSDRNYRGLAAFEVAIIEVLGDIAESVQACAEEQKETVGQLKDLVAAVREIRAILKPKSISLLELTLMPKTVEVGQAATVLLTGVGTDGKPWVFSAADSIAITAATPADVSFGSPTFNSDGSASISATGVNVDPGDAITATADGVTSNSDVLTVVPVAVKLASINLTLQ